ncbi:citrate/2-methylcitrate synthase [Nocardia australiensis]|uniref:citrate/2-methylcitrate synthase n=1 Tax=Nocardia australiensis TaxID=2887191 RepID=UPI001D15BC2C|nr:citrate/2-methylcitrate synthase [Nocardia australiensis]
MEWIDATAATERLGVKPATLYAYGSRGVLTRRYDPKRRRSLFDPAEIEELARRGRPRRKPAPTEIAIGSRITTLGTDRPYFRGRDAVELAASHRFEAVAELLWSGEDTDSGPWQYREDAVAAARTVQAGLPDGLLPLDRLQIIVTTLAVSDPLRFHRDPAAVATIARAVIAGMVEALPQLSAPTGLSASEPDFVVAVVHRTVYSPHRSGVLAGRRSRVRVNRFSAVHEKGDRHHVRNNYSPKQTGDQA